MVSYGLICFEQKPGTQNRATDMCGNFSAKTSLEQSRFFNSKPTLVSCDVPFLEVIPPTLAVVSIARLLLDILESGLDKTIQ